MTSRSTYMACALALVCAAAVAPQAFAQPDGPRNDVPVHFKSAVELESAIAKIDAMYSAAYNKEKIGSYTVGVVSGPTLVWTKSYGMADMEAQVPATKETVYRIGSVTKEFTAVMLAQLVAAGRVHLADPVERHFPQIKLVVSSYPYAPPITIVQLASHKSGLAEEPDDTEKFLTGQVSDWEKTLIAALPLTRYAYEPGTHFNYSNIGYAILGATLASAVGKPYTRYVMDNILVPLHMTHTVFEPTPDTLKHLAKGYSMKIGKPDPSRAAIDLKNGRGYKVPNGALFTTVADLARFLSFQMGDAPDETVLTKATLKDLYSNVYSAPSTLNQGYGLGFEALRSGDFVAIGHQGGVAGFVANVFFDPKTHLGFVELHNATNPGYNDDLPLEMLMALTQ
jgi:CubicO group peptidase (beta-lactamase class C family)